MDHSYFVVAIRYPRRVNGAGVMVPAAVEALVNPEITRREIIDRILSGDYERDRIAFIHEIRAGEIPSDITEDILASCDAIAYGRSLKSAMDFIGRALSPSERIEAMRDHARDHQKNGAL